MQWVRNGLVGDVNKYPPPSQEQISEYQSKGKPKPASANAQYLDKDKRPLKTEDVPEAVRSFVAKNWSPRDGAMALLQVDTGNVDKSKIATTQWRRGHSSCNVGDFENGIMVYVTEPNTDRIDVRKLGYETISLKLPAFSKGQVAWLGKFELKLYQGKTATISGTINDIQGKSLKTAGWITFGLNGADYEKTINVQHGRFIINDVSPGEYLVFFHFPQHSVETWFAKVSGNVAKTLTAYPQNRFTLRSIENGQSQEIKLCPRILNDAGDVTFLDLSFRQFGEEIHLHSPFHRVEIERKGGQREVQSKGSTSWSGKLSPGDRIVLFDLNSQKTAQIIEVVDAQ